MGASASIMPSSSKAPVDYRVERCKRQFLLPQNAVEKLWVLFSSYDREGNHYVTMDDFFERIIKFPRTGLTDAMFRLIESKSDTFLTFGEFVEVVCTFCCFEKMELLRYFFYILDIQKTGLVEKNEIKHFVQMIWNHDYSSNLKEALDYLDKTDDGDGTFNFKEIMAMQEKYPNAFFPIYKLQIQIIHNTLGDWFWDTHKAQMEDAKDRRLKKEIADMKKRQLEDKNRANSINDDMVLKRMGYFKFYCMPWLKEKERTRIAKIIEIEKSLNKFKDTKKTGGGTVAIGADEDEDEEDY